MVKEKRHSGFHRFLVTVVIIAVIGCGGWYFVTHVLKEKAADVVTDHLLNEAIQATGADSETVQQIMDSMAPEDKKKVETIVEDHMNAKTIKDVQGYVSNGDKQGLKEYAKSQLDDQEQAELYDIAKKYAGEYQYMIPQQ
jgi:HSP90 family molecular chaperone